MLDRPVVAGHKRYSRDQCEPCIEDGRFYGIDTGCVYGGCLTALWMPSGKIAQVRAARVYSALSHAGNGVGLHGRRYRDSAQAENKKRLAPCQKGISNPNI